MSSKRIISALIQENKLDKRQKEKRQATYWFFRRVSVLNFLPFGKRERRSLR